VSKHRVLIAEDHDIARLGLRLTLEKMPDVEIVGEAVDGDSVLVQVEQFEPSIILMDINLPGLSGIQATKLIKGSHPQTNIIMFTSDSSDETVFAALSAGADGYCLKNIAADQLRIAIESVAQGAAWLDSAIAQRVLRAQAQAKQQAEQDKSAANKNPLKQKVVLEPEALRLLEFVERGLKLDQIAAKLQLSQSSVEEKLRTILLGLSQTFPQAEKHSAIEGDKQESTMPSGWNSSSAPSQIVPGIVLAGRFKIEAILGSGGMSTVYRGKDLSIGRTVAIKMLHQQPLTDDKEIQRFLLEAKTASAVSHPNIITIFDFGLTSSGQPYIVMDYIDGISLDELIKQKKLIIERTLNIFVQVCDAMVAAHKRGIIHRDLKPSNIMLIKGDDDKDIIKLVDFGMAKFIIESEDLKLSRTGDLFGTPLYMSPEHFRSEKLDHCSDVYSLGCVLYEALSGAPPFSGVSLYELMNCHIKEDPSRLPFLRPEIAIPKDLETLLFSMLAKDIKDRPQSMTDIKFALQKTLQNSFVREM
jgi:DNA-binding NarL/FixJ family response regulator/tRNA A-37 threonylcarbamoyl transferase component Bud32